MESNNKILAQNKNCPVASPCNSQILFPQQQSNGNGTTINTGVLNISINQGCIPPCNQNPTPPPSCSCSEIYNEELKKCVPKCSSEKNQIFDSNLSKCICYKDAIMNEDGTCTCQEGFLMDHQSKTCVDRCPKVEEVWNSEKEKCVSICSDDQIYNSGSGKCECTNSKIWNALESKCNCPIGKKENSEGICITECPADKQFEVAQDGSEKCVDRCTQPSQWDLETKQCICPEGMIFSIGDNNCICSERMKLVENKCVEVCEKGQIYNRQDEMCEEKCKEEDGVGYCIVTDVCKCLDDAMVYNENKKVCEKPADPKNCEDPREVWNNENQNCDCDKTRNFSYAEDLGCTCLQPYKENTDGTACIFDPQCKEGQEWSAVNEQCENKCQANEVWNSETSACEIPKCESTNQIYNEEKKQCVERCPEGQKWCNVCKQCTEACSKDSGFVWDSEKKDCVKQCPPPKSIYNPTTKECECPDTQVFNQETNQCENKCTDKESIDFCSTIGSCKVCNPFKKFTALPTTKLKNDVTYNLGFSPECNNRGYLISGVCYCPNLFKGDKCEIEVDQIGIVNGKTMTSHLNLMFSIWIGYYPNQDDPMFPRTQASIGTGRAWRGPTGNSWVQMHSLVNQKFTIFEGNCKVNILDITQGSYGNCYLVAALAALASLRSCIIKDSFLTHEDNPEHIYVTRWFMHGRPRIVAVDDWIPAENGVPTGVPPNGRDTFWVQILEKAWSKMLGSYRNTSGGNQCDVFTALTGAPNEMYYHQNERDLKVMFNTICGWLKIGRPVGSVAHSGQLDNGHAYAIVGCYTVTLNGQTHDLIKHYNPYNQGSRYKNNPWGDNSPNLNAVKDQIPDFIGDDKDGYTYQNLSDFKNNFSFVIASWSMPGYTPLVFETPWNQEVRYGNWASYSWTLTVKAPQVGKRLFIYIHDGTARGIDEAAWQCKDLVATDKNGTQTKSFKVNSGRYPIDKYNQIIVESPIEGDYTITANVYQNKEFGSFPLAVYAVTDGVQFNEPFKKYELYDQRYQKPCSQTCTSGLCNFSRGQCA